MVGLSSNVDVGFRLYGGFGWIGCRALEVSQEDGSIQSEGQRGRQNPQGEAAVEKHLEKR
jgi:hypothetical protein